MNDPSDSTSQNRLILTSLSVIIIFILGLVVVLSAYPVLLAPDIPTGIDSTRDPSPTITLTPTVTLTPTITRTRRPTLTPTITPTASKTPVPSLTFTPPGPPTLTPALPLASNNLYQLQTWTSEQAAHLIDLMEDYPNTLPATARGDNDENYYEAFKFVTMALSEALLRFPDAPESQQWRWRLALNLARVGDPAAADHFAELITQSLNSGEVKPEDLDDWFFENEKRLELTAIQIDSPEDYLNAWLVDMSGAGSAHLLILETHSGYQSYVLTNNFDFVNKPDYAAFTNDLNGDGFAEIVIYPADNSGATSLDAPTIFSLAEFPPLELNIEQSEYPFEIGMEFDGRWEPVENREGSQDLRFRTTVFPACPLEITRTHHWNGEVFELTEVTYSVDPNPSTLSFCRFIVDHAAAAWGPGAAASIMETLATSWPPSLDQDGKPYPIDAQDEWQFWMGVYHALAGNRERADEILKELTNLPSVSNRQWVDAANRFKGIYKSEGDLYRACLEVEHCDPRLALSRIVETLPRDSYSTLLSTLWDAGITQRTSGYFDFDGDDTKESWFTVRHRPSEKLELWVLMPYRDAIQPLFVDVIDKNRPEFSYYDDDQLPPVILLDGSQPFVVKRVPGSQKPYLVRASLPQFFPDRFREGVAAAKIALLTGTDPSTVQKELLALQKSPGLLCRNTWSCDEYYYLVGLAAEMAGDKSTAIEYFLRLWRDYLRSPFTIMARLKLRGTGVLPSATITGTLPATATPVGSLTPTLTGTPPTATSTSPGTIPSATATISPTPSTPYPINTLPYP